MNINHIEEAVILQAELEKINEALKASKILCIIPDCCGSTEVELTEEAKRIAKMALREYAKTLESKIESL